MYKFDWWPPKRLKDENFHHYERRRRGITEPCTCLMCQGEAKERRRKTKRG